MKNILFILGISIVLFSCKKDKLGGISTFTGCPGMYDYRSSSLDLSVYDSIKWYYDTGCWGMEPISSDTVYRSVTVNPNNPYEIAYVEWISSNSGNAYSLYTYNFCTNSKVSIYNGPIYGGNRVSWSANDKLFFIQGAAIMRIGSDGGDLTTLFLIYESQKAIYCNPDGTLFAVTFSNYPAKDSVKIYKEDGTEIFTIPEPSSFLGWYDDAHVLTSFDGQTIKINVLTGSQEFFLSGEYYSYDYKTKVFLKTQDSLAYQKWLVINEDGGIINEMPYHYSIGSFKGVNTQPIFGLNNKLIVNLESNEFYPDKHTFSCELKTRNNIIIMDMDGTNVRKVEFPE